MTDSALHSLLTSLSRALQGEQRQAALAGGLLPVQWSILCYLRDANRYSNTPAALTEFLGLTKGTVSQSLKLLEAQGWISRQGDPRDRRVLRLALTRSGRRQLDDTADQEWQAAIGQLPEKERLAVEATLAGLLRHWQQARSGRSFGVCRSCRHFGPGDPGHQCGLTGEPLSEADSRLICREHELP
jgi:MarR family transcriptional regulator, negative regulator of the multidrug operon emrRAB